MKHRLYIVEGLPCSGKSSTSAFAADLLKKTNKVSYFDEGSGCHPADYEFHAFLSEQNISHFSAEEQDSIRNCSERIGGGYAVPLGGFKGELFNWLLKYKIYDFLPWKIEMPVMLEKWHKFTQNAENGTVYVFNCVLLQNPMCETMMRFGFSEEQSQDYISKIVGLLEPMEPVVIYLKNDDISESVKKASAQREGWLEGVIDYHINGAYGKSINAHGFDGYIACLSERQRRELSILSKLPIKSLVLDNAQRNWADAYRKIEDFINGEAL